MSEPVLSESPALPLLFAQLQTRYPTSGLLTELIQMEVDRCVVRALVQLGSMTLATSMATAATVEQAEDQARLRVLALLGIHTMPFSVPIAPTLPSRYSPPAQSLTNSHDPTQFADALEGMALQNPTATIAPLPVPIAPSFPFPTSAFEPSATIAMTPVAAIEPSTTVPLTDRGFDALPDRDDMPYDALPDDALPDDAPDDEASYDAPFEEPEPLSSEEAITDAEISAPAIDEPAIKSKPRKTSADKQPVSETDSDPSSGGASRDLSSLISQIGVEIDRIGWSKRQGSTYLQKTYAKKTRSELTDDELEDFLTYLNTQPSATVD